LRSTDSFFKVCTQDTSGQRIGKNETMLQDLMGSSVKSGAQCGGARLSLLHDETPVGNPSSISAMSN
jgi:hypothetical protein